MVKPEEARLRFLKEAAHLLAIPSPSTSAFLGAQRDRLLARNDLSLQTSQKQWNAHRRESCGVCGTIMTPGWFCEVTQEPFPDRPVRNQKKGLPGVETKAVVYSCLQCHQKTVQPIAARPAKHISKSIASKGLETEPAVIPAQVGSSKVAKSANASSKQRAKARKGGLQAMLAKSKPEKGGFGLDLMDFMQ